jgi:hypothetical protein
MQVYLPADGAAGHCGPTFIHDLEPEPRIGQHETHGFRTQNVRNHVYGGGMTTSDCWREPPLAGTEAEHLS